MIKNVGHSLNWQSLPIYPFPVEGTSSPGLKKSTAALTLPIIKIILEAIGSQISQSGLNFMITSMEVKYGSTDRKIYYQYDRINLTAAKAFFTVHTF